MYAYNSDILVWEIQWQTVSLTLYSRLITREKNLGVAQMFFVQSEIRGLKFSGHTSSTKIFLSKI